MYEDCSREYVEKHKRVKEKFEEITGKNPCACVSVRQIAQELQMDERTVRTHLEIIRLYKKREYFVQDEKLFTRKRV